jgi:glucokinase
MPGPSPTSFAVLEIGGSHVTGALVDLAPTAAAEPVGRTARSQLDSAGTAEAIVSTLVEVGARLHAPAGSRWAVAFPGPFDYPAGVARYTGVGKFDALRDVDMRAALAVGLGVPPTDFHFVNDADAFALGVWASGSGQGRLVALTLGTGVGSSFVADGACVVDGDTVPPDAELHLTSWNGAPLEETVSHRAIVRAYAATTGVVVPGVREVVELARVGDEAAAEVLRAAYTALGGAVAPWIDRFGGTDLAFGGSVSAAWDLIEPPVTEGLRSALVSPLPRLSVVADTEQAALIGAAFSAQHAG